MATISEAVEHAPAAVFAVDDGLRIVAWNQAAEEGLGMGRADVLGAVCYERIRAVDSQTGRPCYEQCPLVNPSLGRGWIQSRVLEARWRNGTPARLDCMLLHYASPSSERGALCFITPMDGVDAERYYQAMAALEALYPLLTRTTSIGESIRTVVRAVAQATGADVAELVLLDRRLGEPRLVVRQSLDPSDNRDHESLVNHRDVLELAIRNDGSVTIFQLPPGGTRDACWHLAIPLSAGGATLGVLSIGSRRVGFPVGLAARILFAIGCQLGAFLGWASSTGQPGIMESAGGRPASPAVLYFHCFGRFRILIDGREIPSRSFARQKSLAVLKVLVAHRGRPLHREWLVDYLWPEADPTLGSNNLRVVLHDLRRALEPSLKKGEPSSFILTQGDLLYLDPSDRCWVDVEEFDRLIRKFDTLLNQGRVDDALTVGREAVTLPTGDYMEDEPYLDWCIAERERLREVRINLLQRMAAVHAERNQLDEAIAICRQALAADALREDLHARLIELLGRAGRREEALRQYEICRNVLQQELGVAPDEETRNIYRAIRDQPGRLSRR